MRIIAGDWRGRKLTAPAGDTTRPTADRTRETLFSMLVSRLGSFEGLSVADLFAGSGALWGWALFSVISFMVHSLGAEPGARPSSTDFIKVQGPLIVIATVILPAIIAAVIGHWQRSGRFASAGEAAPAATTGT